MTDHEDERARAHRRRRLDDVFGDVLPLTTGDEVGPVLRRRQLAAAGSSSSGSAATGHHEVGDHETGTHGGAGEGDEAARDVELLRDVPPHHA